MKKLSRIRISNYRHIEALDGQHATNLGLVLLAARFHNCVHDILMLG